MKVLGAARRAFSVLAANPVIFVGSSVVSGFSFVLILAQSLGRVGIALSYGSILVNPFLMGGLYGAVEIALERSPRIDDLVSEAKTNYVDLLVVTLLVAALSFVAVFALVIAAAFVGIGYVALTSALLPSVGGSVLVFAPLVPFYLLFVIALVLAYAVFQFFDVAVVIDDETALDALRTSYSLTKERLVSVLGYTAVRGALTLLPSLPLYFEMYQDIRRFDFESSAATAAPVIAPSLSTAAAVFVINIPVIAFAFTFHVVYYRGMKD